MTASITMNVTQGPPFGHFLVSVYGMLPNTLLSGTLTAGSLVVSLQGNVVTDNNGNATFNFIVPNVPYQECTLAIKDGTNTVTSPFDVEEEDSQTEMDQIAALEQYTDNTLAEIFGEE